MSEPTNKDWDNMEWLHVYGQYTYHAEATIRGTLAGLTRLRNAIDAAIKDGLGQVVVMASDGEGYEVNVSRVSLHDQLGKPEYIGEVRALLLRQEAERAREHGLRDPYGSYKRIDRDPT